jgi:hypothetical protein
VWIEKDTFLPLRWIMKPGATGSDADSIDVRYLNWRPVENVWYPMQVEFYVNETLQRRIDVVDVAINESFSNHLFDIEYLKSIYPMAVPDQAPYEEIEEVQETIEEFRKIYED